jgi:hypothetical protein
MIMTIVITYYVPKFLGDRYNYFLHFNIIWMKNKAKGSLLTSSNHITKNDWQFGGS